MGIDTALTRKQFLLSALGAAGLAALPTEARAKLVEQAVQAGDLVEADVLAMEKVLGFSLTEPQRKQVLSGLKELKKEYAALQARKIPNSVAPPIPFVPEGKQPAPGKATDVRVRRVNPETPKNDEDLAFLSAVELSHLIRTRKVTPSQLTKVYLDRVKRYGGPLLNVITVTEARAMETAKRLDAELERGKNRGPLHGLPYGLKDLFATAGDPTTWGAAPFKNQWFDYDSTVVEKLEAAGAVLIAKTSVGALAMDDHWFGGKTKSPWNLAQGSSGSSAGSASGMAAGLFAFAIGTETLGSIMSPSHRCRVTGLRPTFGRVSRHGAMALSWTMDKVGPICRTAEDCALVLAAIHGHDPRDNATVDRPFRYRHDLDLSKLKIGYLANDSGLDEDDTGTGPDDALKILRSHGAKPQPVKFTATPPGVDRVLVVEAAAAFEEITRDARVNEIQNSLWPNIFRENQFTSGVGFVQAMRARTQMMRQFEQEFGDYDLIITSDRGSFLLINTNLTGHPQVYIPFGVDSRGVNRGVSLIGRLYDEGTILAVAARLQRETDFWKRRPDLTKAV